MHTASYEFVMKPKESARCHQTLSSRVGYGDKTTYTNMLVTVTCHMTMAEKFDWLRVIWLRLKYWWQHKTWENQPYTQSYNGWLRTYGIQWRQNSDITYSIHLLSSLLLSSSILCRSSGGVCGGITGSHYWSHHELDDVIQPHIIVKQRVAILKLCGDTPTIKVETSRQCTLDIYSPLHIVLCLNPTLSRC